MDFEKLLQEFDLKFYTSYYPDLSSMKRQYAKAWLHYKNHGCKEGRLINEKQLKQLQDPVQDPVTELNNEITNMQLHNKESVLQHDIERRVYNSNNESLLIEQYPIDFSNLYNKVF